jgi:uncharacterized protein YbbK (DUF523 family)
MATTPGSPASSAAPASAAPASPRAAARPAILVSACLCGVACNHEGEAAAVDLRPALAARFRVVPVCPEVCGGLPTPRVAAEIQADGRVRTRDGADVTAAFERGARTAVALAAATGATHAVMKSRSPSCGSGQVYDGTFSRTLVAGEGVAAQALREAGVVVSSEDDPLPVPPSAP